MQSFTGRFRKKANRASVRRLLKAPCHLSRQRDMHIQVNQGQVLPLSAVIRAFLQPHLLLSTAAEANHLASAVALFTQKVNQQQQPLLRQSFCVLWATSHMVMAKRGEFNEDCGRRHPRPFKADGAEGKKWFAGDGDLQDRLHIGFLSNAVRSRDGQRQLDTWWQQQFGRFTYTRARYTATAVSIRSALLCNHRKTTQK